MADDKNDKSQVLFEDPEKDMNGWQRFMKFLVSVSNKGVSLWHKLPFTPDEPLYETESSKSTDFFMGVRNTVIDLSFMLYSLFAGFILEQYCQWLCWRFAAYAFGVDVLHGRLMSSPLTVIVDAFLVIGGLVVYAVFAGFVYVILKTIYFRNSQKDDGQDELQAGAMLGVLVCVVVVIICLLVGHNIFAGV